MLFRKKEEAQTILVVEDDIEIRRLIRLTLKRENYTVITARDGKEGYDKVKEERPGLVITDVLMPRMGGFDLVRCIKQDEELKSTPVIVLTSLDQYSNMKTGYRFGADLYLNKPFSPEKLLLEVKRCLREEYSERSED